MASFRYRQNDTKWPNFELTAHFVCTIGCGIWCFARTYRTRFSLLKMVVRILPTWRLRRERRKFHVIHD